MRLRPGPGFVTLDVLALAVMCAGVVVLIRSPLVGGLSGTGSDEYLGANPVAGANEDAARGGNAVRPIAPDPAAKAKEG